METTLNMKRSRVVFFILYDRREVEDEKDAPMTLNADGFEIGN